MNPLPTRRGIAATIAAALLLTGTAAFVAHEQDVASASHQGRAQRATDRLLQDRGAELSGLVDGVQAELRDGHPVAEILRRLPDGAFGARAVLDGVLAVSDPRLAGSATLRPEALRSGVVRGAAAAATDRGAALAAVAPVAGTPVIVIIWPLYRGPLPLTTAARRSAQAGWAVAAVRTPWLSQPAHDAATALGYRVAPSGPQPVAAGLVTTVAADAVGVRVADRGPDQPLLPWILLGVLAIGLLATGAVTSHRARQRDQAIAATQSLLEQIRLLGDLGVTAQETLDVSLTLPAMLLQLSTRLRLDYVAVLTGSDPQPVELLALGTRPSAAMTVRFPLHRSLRTIGALEIARAAPITAAEQETVRAIADVISGSLFNSELFEREQAAVQRLQDVDRLKDNFLGTVSHELRTPLSILVGYSAMLRKRWETMPEPDKFAAVTTIETHVGALTNLVNDLLDFVTDRNSAQHVNLTPVRLAVPVRELVERYTPLLGRHQLTMALDERLEVVTDARAVERILTNLLSNASKYSPAGSVIAVTVTDGRDGVELGVRDHGPGIADTERALIFERFYRGNTDAARSTRGTGIGLTIVKTWLEMVGARLEVRSRVGVGTQMSVVFPRSGNQALVDAGHIVWREDHPPSAVGTVPT